MTGHSSRVSVLDWKLSCFCVHKGGSLGGGWGGVIDPSVPRSLRTSLDDSVEEQGGPSAPPPRGVFLKVVLSFV